LVGGVLDLQAAAGRVNKFSFWDDALERSHRFQSVESPYIFKSDQDMIFSLYICFPCYIIPLSYVRIERSLLIIYSSEYTGQGRLNSISTWGLLALGSPGRSACPDAHAALAT
jgi:hypothetical protein